MNISEEQLKELVLRVLSDLEAEKRAECMKAVSYTHLDVYKRQVSKPLNIKKNAPV